MSQRLKTRIAAVAAALVTVLAVVTLTRESRDAASSQKTPLARMYRLTVDLERSNVLDRLLNTHRDVWGTITASVDRDYKGEGGQALWLDMTTFGLTGPVTAVHIHTGAPGASGRVILTLCGDASDASCNPLSGYWWGFSLPPIFTGPAYIDVHTRRNPEGELRGQIELTPAGES